MPRRWTQEELDAVRTQPLEPIARQLGYRQDPRDRARWKRSGSVLSINAATFYDHQQGTGGAGAFDLLMHARKCSFAEAASILVPQPHLPEPCNQRWSTLREYLVEARGIPPRILDACKRHGILYADRRQNAVFLCTNARRQTTGAEILGTRNREKPFKAMARGSRKASGAFWIPASNQKPDTVFLAESALDALSAFSLQETPKGATVFVSNAGATPAIPTWIEAWKPNRILCAYDADNTGDQCAKALAKHDPRVERFRPKGAKDWNEIIQRKPPAQ